MQSHTSAFVSVRIDVEPNNVEHTSPEIFDDVENRFITRYPTASEPTESIAIAASPCILGFCPVLKISIAAMIVTGITINEVFVRSKIVAIASAPNATWDSPSPIYENLFNTNITPSNDEQSAIKVPTIRAYLTNGYDR
jgi:hypothetical protein